jgi:hypothetical protein
MLKPGGTTLCQGRTNGYSVPVMTVIGTTFSNLTDMDHAN